VAELVKAGYTITRTNRVDTPKISERLLADNSQIWLFFDGKAANGLSEAELELISSHNAASKGILMVAAPLPDAAIEQPANRLASRYGIRFSGLVESGQKLKVSVASNLFNSASEWLGSLLKIVNKA